MIPASVYLKIPATARHDAAWYWKRARIVARVQLSPSIQAKPIYVALARHFSADEGVSLRLLDQARASILGGRAERLRNLQRRLAAGS